MGLLGGVPNYGLLGFYAQPEEEKLRLLQAQRRQMSHQFSGQAGATPQAQQAIDATYRNAHPTQQQQWAQEAMRTRGQQDNALPGSVGAPGGLPYNTLGQRVTDTVEEQQRMAAAMMAMDLIDPATMGGIGALKGGLSAAMGAIPFGMMSRAAPKRGASKSVADLLSSWDDLLPPGRDALPTPQAVDETLVNDLLPKDYANEYVPRARPDVEPYMDKIIPKRNLPRIRGGERAGQYIGAPDGVKTPRQFDAVAKRYAKRVMDAFDQGAKPGWFYDDAGNIMRETSGGNPQTAENILGSSAIVSAGNRISNERGMSGRAVEQWDMGRGRPDTEPLEAGQYRRQDRLMERVFDHTSRGGRAHDIFQGPKIDEYGAAVSGQGNDTAAEALGANDRWEAWSVYGGADPDVSPDAFSAPTEAQHKFLHSMRLRAAEIIARERPDIGWMVPKEVQELNWAASKAIGEKKNVSDLVHTERWGGQNLERNITNQTWEARPGKNADHFPGMTSEQNAPYHRGVVDQLIDPASGHDRLMTGLGSSQQARAVEGPGVFTDDTGALQINPGVSSQGIGAAPYSTVSPTTAARVKAQEYVRGTVLGQDAIASTMMGPGGKISAINIRRPLEPEHARAVQQAIDDAFGPDNYIGISNTRGGYNITDNIGTKGFSQTFTKKVLPVIEGQHKGAVPLDKWTNARHPSGEGGLLYEELPWQGEGPSPVTHEMLKAIDDPNIPAMPGLADSAHTRGVMGNLAAHNEATQKLTGLIPNEKIQTLLNIWSTQGMVGVREAAKKGIVPAIAVAVLAEMAQPSDPVAAPEGRM